MNHLDISWTGQFKKDYKLAVKRHQDIGLLDDIIRKLASGEQHIAIYSGNKTKGLFSQESASGVISEKYKESRLYRKGLHFRNPFRFFRPDYSTLFTITPSFP